MANENRKAPKLHAATQNLELKLADCLSVQVNQNRVPDPNSALKSYKCLIVKTLRGKEQQLVYQITWKYFLNAPQTFNALIWHMSGSPQTSAGEFGVVSCQYLSGDGWIGWITERWDSRGGHSPFVACRWHLWMPQSGSCGVLGVIPRDFLSWHSTWMWVNGRKINGFEIFLIIFQIYKI